MSNVGDIVFYTPTDAEFPMHGGKPQPAIITGVDTLKGTASLTVFFEGNSYLVTREKVSQGTTAGTFQQAAAPAKK